jgi:Putative beta barrel porin-7 (BBP7)
VRYAAVLVALVLSLALADAASAQTAGSDVGRFTIGAEALLWWFKSSPTPVPLITNGTLDQPGTRVFLGGDSLDTGANPGFRVTAGYGLTERWGIEGSFFYVPPRSTSRSVASSGQPGSTDLILPFFDVVNGFESGTNISQARSFRGSATETLSNNLLGAELNASWALRSGGPWRVDLLGGFRYLRLRETYSLTTSSPNIPPFPLDVFNTTDEFETTNNFYGLQAGARTRFDWGRWFATGALKFGLGAMVQSVDISGSLVTNDFNAFRATQTFSGGYFALPSNIGNHTRTVFAVVPEVGLNLGYRITDWASVFAGYTFLYTNNVARPAKQINRNVNATQSVAITDDPAAALVGAAQPSFKFNSSDFWAQGLNVGLAFRF